MMTLTNFDISNILSDGTAQYPCGFFFCQFQLSLHISSIPYSLIRPVFCSVWFLLFSLENSIGSYMLSF